MTRGHVTHEAGADGRTACNHGGDLASVPGTSTCGQVFCREIRAQLRANSGPSWLVAWPTPFTPARAYAAKAYSTLRNSICPGGTGHEGNGASAEYCDACLADAIALAYEAGERWQR
jgi:hypothetical protein